MKRRFGRGIPPIRGLAITMVINHLLTGMILQVPSLKRTANASPANGPGPFNGFPKGRPIIRTKTLDFQGRSQRHVDSKEGMMECISV